MATSGGVEKSPASLWHHFLALFRKEQVVITGTFTSWRVSTGEQVGLLTGIQWEIGTVTRGCCHVAGEYETEIKTETVSRVVDDAAFRSIAQRLIDRIVS